MNNLCESSQGEKLEVNKKYSILPGLLFCAGVLLGTVGELSVVAAEAPPVQKPPAQEMPSPPEQQAPPQFVVGDRIIKKILARGVPAVALDRVLTFMGQYMGHQFAFKHDEAVALTNKTWAAIIDYTQPSTNYRFYLINFVTGAVERYLVAHAKKSGDVVATDFGNVHNSNKTSLGIYLTGRSYQGKRFGTGRILYGLEVTNDNAHLRGVVMHGATYMSPSFMRNNGRPGRSQGCPALERNSFKRVHSLLGKGAVLFHYHSKLPKTFVPSQKVKVL